MEGWAPIGRGEAPILSGRAAHAGERVGGYGEERRELAGGKSVEGAEAAGEFHGGQAALPVEVAEKIVCAPLTLV